MYAHRMGCAPPYAVINGRMPMVRMGQDAAQPSTTEKFYNWLDTPNSTLSSVSNGKFAPTNKTLVGVGLAAGVLWYGHTHRWF